MRRPMRITDLLTIRAAKRRRYPTPRLFLPVVSLRARASCRPMKEGGTAFGMFGAGVTSAARGDRAVISATTPASNFLPATREMIPRAHRLQPYPPRPAAHDLVNHRRADVIMSGNFGHTHFPIAIDRAYLGSALLGKFAEIFSSHRSVHHQICGVGRSEKNSGNGERSTGKDSTYLYSDEDGVLHEAASEEVPYVTRAKSLSMAGLC